MAEGRMMIAFEPVDLEKIDRYMFDHGLPTRASALRMMVRQVTDLGSIPGVQKAAEMSSSPVADLEAGWELLDAVHKRTGGNWASMRQRVLKMKGQWKWVRVGDADKLAVSRQFIETVEQEKENPNWT